MSLGSHPLPKGSFICEFVLLATRCLVKYSMHYDIKMRKYYLECGILDKVLWYELEPLFLTKVRQITPQFREKLTLKV